MADQSSSAVSAEIAYFRSLRAVRETCSSVLQLALNADQQLDHFSVHMDRIDSVVQMVVELIKRDYKSVHDVPSHSRWRHFDVGGRKRVQELIDQWTVESVDRKEQVRRLLDLFVVSVLVDAGAGDKWKYKESSSTAGSSEVYERSEGLAVASWHMFIEGRLSSDPKRFPHRVDADALENLTADHIRQAFQVDDDNPLVGVEGRTMLLNRLGAVLKSRPDYFKSRTGDNVSRPGNLLDYLLDHSSTKKSNDCITVEMETFWQLIVDGFGGIWPPSRTKIGSTPMGDVWPCQALLKLKKDDTPGTASLVAFHKLSQWLTYSLMEPMAKLLNVRFNNMQLMTGLAEYRNGGLFVDMGVLELKKATHDEGIAFAKLNGQGKDMTAEIVPLFEVQHPAIIEWRALTVALLDEVGARVCKVYGLTQEQLPLVCVLEGGTWKAGREVAAKKRPQSKGPPIQIKSDGTVF